MSLPALLPGNKRKQKKTKQKKKKDQKHEDIIHRENTFQHYCAYRI